MKIKMNGVDPTIKQRLWLDAYIECHNATEAAMRIYDCKDRDVAKSIGSENLAKLDFAALMEAQGLSDSRLNEKLYEGLEANKQLATRVIFRKDAPTSQSARELPTATGMTDDFIEVPDYAVRHKYLETAYKLKKRLGNDGSGVQINAENAQINIAFVSPEKPSYEDNPTPDQ